MWTCPKCQEASEDTFDACWKCGTTKSGEPPAPEATSVIRKIDCLRCESPMASIGRKDFHEGTNWGLLGAIGEMFVNQESFELFRCPKCGKVEFFVGGEGGPTPP
jgi:hypothetical protein